MITVRVVGLDQSVRALRAGRAATGTLVPAAIGRAGAAGLTQVRVLASTGYHTPGEGHIPGTGPGPNVATGDYRREMTLETAEYGGVSEAAVYTDAVQAERLEYGFIGRDSLGRYFHQPAYPHWGPAADAMDEHAPPIVEAAGEQIERVISVG